MKVSFQTRRRSERGYVLLILLLAVAFLSIAALTAVEDIHNQIQRDREEELIHRGVQYARAIKNYYRKFGRYPTRVEDLESTNHLRFLRKRYKDPMNRDPATGKEKDFKFLHLTDVQSSFNTGPTNDWLRLPICQINPGSLAQPVRMRTRILRRQLQPSRIRRRRMGSLGGRVIRHQ